MGNDIFKLAKKIQGEIKKGVDEYHTGLVGEQMIVAAYQTMSLEKLQKMQFIISKLIKKKKEFKRVEDARHHTSSSDNPVLHNGQQNIRA